MSKSPDRKALWKTIKQDSQGEETIATAIYIFWLHGNNNEDAGKSGWLVEKGGMVEERFNAGAVAQVAEYLFRLASEEGYEDSGEEVTDFLVQKAMEEGIKPSELGPSHADRWVEEFMEWWGDE